MESKKNSIVVFDKRMAEKLIQWGYFYALNGIAVNHRDASKRVYYFDNLEPVKKFIDEYTIDQKIINDALSEVGE